MNQIWDKNIIYVNYYLLKGLITLANIWLTLDVPVFTGINYSYTEMYIIIIVCIFKYYFYFLVSLNLCSFSNFMRWSFYA